MRLRSRQTKQLFGIMEDLTLGLDSHAMREKVGHRMLDLLGADYFASYVWDEDSRRYIDRVSINMSDANLGQYEDYFQYRDPITPALQRRRRATPVSEIMAHDRLRRTEFFNDFLARDGLCFGMNLFAHHNGRNIGDMRIWRSRKREDFSAGDVNLLDAIGPAFTNALRLSRSCDRAGQTDFIVDAARSECALTPREGEVMALLVRGLTDAQITERLTVSLPTVRSHVQSVFRKCDVSRRTELVSRFLGSGD